jgi:hypothetical protein
MKRVLVILILLACGKTNRLPDEAWGISDYASAGLHIDEPWSAAEYTTAASILKSVTADHRERLPRFRGTKSGPVFDKLLADLPDDRGQPVAERFGAHVQRYDAVNTISKLYVENQFAAVPREYIELSGALLREATVLTRDADAFLASFGPDDPKREVRLAGFAKMKAGYGMMLLGGLLIARESRVPMADRVAMIRHVTAALPTLFPEAPAEAQGNIREAIATLLAAHSRGALHDAVAAAQQAIR